LKSLIDWCSNERLKARFDKVDVIFYSMGYYSQEINNSM